MPIPTPTSNESEKEFISRCIKAIYDEYGQEQSAGICYGTWRKKNRMSAQQRVQSRINEIKDKA